MRKLGELSEWERGIFVFGAASIIPFSVILLATLTIPSLMPVSTFLFVLPVFAIIAVEMAVQREQNRDKD